ncbi:hypothetical protein BU25DRAFT_445706 [Macroventuria anomochaeta]|uniref:Uncharacterized protein n=1 Tax=Macroventuria anomochaeta TaxID=301207 RepID=A0ACB6SE75_9PLEO|nr:uncharacterized protein BU25DRAFT_445706 [Macroventuria anomochaeta]KAF2631604.1 hypothetical protein BU25DRAFT_445706 [Macroventuria anomochaeta]
MRSVCDERTAVLPRFKGCLCLARAVRGLAGAIRRPFLHLARAPSATESRHCNRRHAHDSNKAQNPRAWAALRAPFPVSPQRYQHRRDSDTGFHTCRNDIRNLDSRVGGHEIANAVFTLYVGGGEVGIAATFLDFLTFCLSGISRENNYGTTIESFRMGDGHQLLPPVWWRGWRQHRMEASRVFCLTNDCLCYLLGWRRGIQDKAWHDHDLTREIMHSGLDHGYMRLHESRRPPGRPGFTLSRNGMATPRGSDDHPNMEANNSVCLASQAAYYQSKASLDSRP